MFLRYMRTGINALKKKKKTVFHINELLFFKASEDAIVVQKYFGGVATFMLICVFGKEL